MIFMVKMKGEGLAPFVRNKSLSFYPRFRYQLGFDLVYIRGVISQ